MKKSDTVVSTLICACHEAPFLREWCDHYLDFLGFDHVRIYVNSWDQVRDWGRGRGRSERWKKKLICEEEEARELVARVAEDDRVVIVDWPTVYRGTSARDGIAYHAQVEAQRFTLAQLSWDWSLFCDVDEFLTLRKPEAETVQGWLTLPGAESRGAFRFESKIFADRIPGKPVRKIEKCGRVYRMTKALVKVKGVRRVANHFPKHRNKVVVVRKSHGVMNHYKGACKQVPNRAMTKRDAWLASRV